MASQDPWYDFEGLRHNVKQNTVDRLKQIITGLNDECSTILSKSGKKQELIDRIVQQLDFWKKSNITNHWLRAKAIMYQVRNSGIYSPNKTPADGGAYPPPPTHNYGTNTSMKVNGYHHSPAVGSGSLGRYDPYAPPRKPVPTQSASGSTSSSTKPSIRFKPSPFFRIDETVSTVIDCPESTSQSDRRQGTLTFTLSAEQTGKLNSVNPKYQLRLFCTSSSFYSPGLNAFRTNTGPCPIEFPPTCEVRVNNIQLSANLKGLKKKPGTAPPADLGKAVRLTPGSSNRVEMVYVNSQQGVAPKKYYLIVMLVEFTNVDQLVDRLNKGKYKSSDDILAKMVQGISEDDDIVAGSQKMSLKCPLSYTRIITPCRSALCVHSQCFDATSWFSMMEQTTTWLCPVCERTLNVDDLIVDGYFDSILKQTSEDVDDVIVEADGQWHTSDNKYASARWKATHPLSSTTQPGTPRKPVRKETPARTPSKPVVSADGKGKAKTDNVEILVLDSDDEDDDRVKRELSPSAEGSSSYNSLIRSQVTLPRSESLSENVIDLTLDSDDEAPLKSKRPEKRKAAENDADSSPDQVWKKSRVDGSRSNGHVNGAALSSSSASPSNNAGGNGYSLSGFLSQLIQRGPTNPPATSPTNAAPSSHYRTLSNDLPSFHHYQPSAPASDRHSNGYHRSLRDNTLARSSLSRWKS